MIDLPVFAVSCLLAGQVRRILNRDVADDRRILAEQSWSPRADLVVLDEIHKMRHWKEYLKGVFDGRAEGQAVLVTGSARMETFRQSGESLAGRYFHLRLHPFSVREWVELADAKPEDALDRLMERGGMPDRFWLMIRFRPGAGGSNTSPTWCARMCWSSPAFRRFE